MKNITRQLTTGILGLALLFVPGVMTVSPATAYAASPGPKAAVCNELGAGANCSKSPPNGVSVDRALTAVVNILSLTVGIASVIMVIVGGFRFITASGDSSKAAGARSTIIYAIIGVIIAAFAQFIVQFVLNRLTK